MIFEPFLQADGSATRKYGGTGLGLSICRELSSMMHGEVWAESRLHEGSTFHFTALLNKTGHPRPKALLMPELKAKRVLICDINRKQAAILADQIRSEGMRPVVASPDQTAAVLEKEIENGDAFSFYLINTAVFEKKDNTLIVRIRNADPKIPIIAYGNPAGENPRKIRESGIDLFLRTPVRRKKLIQAFSALDDAGARRHRTKPSSGKKHDKKLQILLAEDNIINRKLLKTMLTKEGHKVDVSVNENEVLEKLYCIGLLYLIFMDIHAEMDGIEAPDHQGKRIEKIPMWLTAGRSGGSRNLESGNERLLPNDQSRTSLEHGSKMVVSAVINECKSGKALGLKKSEYKEIDSCS